MRRIWNFIWRPSSKYSIGALLIVGGIGGILFWGGFNTFMEYTNTQKFCISCHEMYDNVYVEYKETVHYKNASGVRAICSDCHVPRPWIQKVVRKVKATNELYHKAVGTISTPEKFDAHRATMAKRVWAEMEANDSQECRNCHSWDAMDFHAQRPKSAERMKKGMDEGQTCISCHKGIAHNLPNLSTGYKLMFAELQELAATEGVKADTVYTIAETPVYLSEADAKAGKPAAGKLLPATELAVLEREGDVTKFRVEGWQQDGVDRVIYALMGRRIFSIVISSNAIDSVQRLETKHDDDTELTWHRVSIEVWAPVGTMIADREKLWKYGSEMYNASCSVCHTLTSPDHFLANQWIGNLKAMKRFITLDTQQYRFLQKYLQFHARDTGGSHDSGS